MDRLYRLSDVYARQVDLTYIRPLYERIDWEGHLTALLGARGVGKTTLLLQRLRQLDRPTREALYVDLGDLYFQENRLLEFIGGFAEQGGRYLFIDEVHRYGYGTWAQELKQAYDLYRDRLRIVFTGSAAVRILHQQADLSRRVRQVRIPGLSFREYLHLKGIVSLPQYSLQQLLTEHETIVRELLSSGFRPAAHLADYWREGFYPFFLSDPLGYLDRLNTVIQLVLEIDIPAVQQGGRSDYQKLSRLLYAVASAPPFQPNISKLGNRLGMARETILQYLDLLSRADLLIPLRAEAKGVAALAKPDKVYLNNTNLLYALAPTQVDIGTVRETFVLNQLDYLTHEAHILPPELRLPKRGDFVFQNKDQRLLFEVGGPNKGSKQIGTAPDHYVITDTEQTGTPHKIPLWLFGLLY